MKSQNNQSSPDRKIRRGSLSHLARVIAALSAVGSGAVLAQDISLTAPSDIRAVAGAALSDPLAFGVTNTTGSDISVDWSLTAGSAGSLVQLVQPDPLLAGANIVSLASGTPWAGSSVLANASGNLFANPDLSGAASGTSVSFGLEGNYAGISSPVTASMNIGIVENRLLTGSQTIDAGRHIAGLQSIGSVTLDGGSLTGAQGTDISIHSGGYAQFSNGLRLTSGSDFTFDAAGQNHDLQIAYYGPTGSYHISGFTLPGAGESDYTDATGASRQDFGGAWKTSANYGNVFGGSLTFTEEDRSGWDRLPGVSRVWSRPDTVSTSSDDFIHSQELVETAQPTILSERAFIDPVTGVRSDFELARGAGILANERIDPLITGEASALGSSLDLSGVSLDISGTAVSNRSIHGGTVDLGRRMVGAPDVSINQTDTVTLQTSGGDDHATRLTLGDIADSSVSGLNVTRSGIVDFNSASSTAEVTIAGDFTLTTATQGRQTLLVNGAAAITGEGLIGESVQSNLELGYTWNNVENNELVAPDLLVIENVGVSGTRTFNNHRVDQRYSTETHTSIGITAGDTLVSTSDVYEAGLHQLGTQIVIATPEGLAGESVAGAHASFNTKLVAVADAAATFTRSGGEDSSLAPGDSLIITDDGSGIYQKTTNLSQVEISGTDNLEFEVALSGGDASIGHGQSRSLTVSFDGDTSTPVAGSLDRVSRAQLDVTTQEVTDTSAIMNAAGITGTNVFNFALSNSSVISVPLEARFDAPAASTGTAIAASGSDLGEQSFGLSNEAGNTSTRFATGTQTTLLDSAALGADTTITLTFESLDSADAATVDALESSAENTASLAGIYLGNNGRAEFASDVVNLDGLDGTLHVLEINYDPSNILDEAGAQLLWQTDYDDAGETKVAWINAVLGNSDILTLDLLGEMVTTSGGSETIGSYLSSRRFDGSYLDYLADNGLVDPELGAWGVDQETDQVWAAIDHNSAFAAAASAVPEPSSALLAALSLALFSGHRSRK